MSRWWRAYDEAVDDPKLQRLGPALGWAWFNLMCLASKNGGPLPAIGDVAFKLRATEQRAAATIAALVSAGLFDKREDGRFEPHNWGGRQFQSDVSTDRVKRFRNAKRNVSSAVSETAPETETETDTEQITEKKENADASASHSESPPSAPPTTDEADLYRRGKIVLGANAGGLIKKLIAFKGGNIPLARSAIEQASTKSDPREYLGAIIRNRDSPEDLRARGEAW